MLRLKLRPPPKFKHYFLALLLIMTCGTSTVLLAAEPARQEATIYTNLGNIKIDLYPQQAPITVANFVRYIQAGAYEGGSFYRVVRLDNDNGSPKIEVIQGGAAPNFTEFDPIVLEDTEQTGIDHTDGVLSMARGEPNSATQAFFICIGAQPALDKGALRNPDGQGFAAFGRVISGMDIVRTIHQNRDAIDVDDPYIQGQILSEPVTILKISLQY
jgi:peptidyl-prolyl cis-trans isomerase A (cyclophilin A)